MNLPYKKKFWIARLVDKKKDFITSRPFFHKHALNFLNISQFLGVVNDNVFKFLTLFLLIDLKGVESSSQILFWVGTVYVLPFLLFSSAAGILADKFSKQKIIVALKGLEVIITILGVLAFWFGSAWACYTLLFMLSFQSAVFGPPKYSIIPEIVKFEKISKANGIITSFTYLAIILGTFLASFTTQITHKNFTLSASLCVLIAIIGFLTSLFLPYTKPSRTTKKINTFFIKEIYKTLVFCLKKPFLLSAVLSSAFFLYIGAFFQLNIIPFAIESLKISEVGGGYLFLTVAIGIALGAIIAGKLSKNKVEIGLSCFACFGLSLFLYFLSLFPSFLTTTLIFLILNGICGGLFIVPFDSYIQTYSPQKERGQVIAASNFLSFLGVLLAPSTLYLFSGTLKLQASTGFFFMAMLVMLVAFILLFHFSGIFLNFLSRKIFLKIYQIKLLKSPFDHKNVPLVIMPQSSMTKALLLSSVSENLHFFIFRHQRRFLDIFYNLFSNVTVIYIKNLKTSAVEIIQKKNKENKLPCLLLSKSLKLEDAQLHPEAIGDMEALYLHIEKTPSETDKKELVFRFSETP